MDIACQCKNIDVPFFFNSIVSNQRIHEIGV